LISLALRSFSAIITVAKPEKEGDVPLLNAPGLDKLLLDGGPGRLVGKRTGPTA
jgi:hypothetical protein